MSDALAALAGLPGFLPAGFAAALVALGAFASLAGFSACLEFVGLGFAGLDLDAAWLEGVGLALALVALTGADAVLEGAAAGDLAPALSLAMADWSALSPVACSGAWVLAPDFPVAWAAGFALGLGLALAALAVAAFGGAAFEDAALAVTGFAGAALVAAGFVAVSFAGTFA